MENISNNVPISEECLNEMDELFKKLIWVPSVIAQDCNHHDYFKQHRAIFNKITTVNETFPELVKQFEELITGESEERIKEVVVLYFDKVIDEPVFLNTYVQFTIILSSRVASFKKAIIGKCQKQFEENVLNLDLNERLLPILQEIHEAKNSNERDAQQIIYDEEKRKLTKKSTNIVRFIGELFNSGMLTPNIMLFCVGALLDRNSEPTLECLCNLLTTIGARLENTAAFKCLNVYETLLEIANNKNRNVQICSRLHCLILNVINLQKDNCRRQRETRALGPVKLNLNQRKGARRSISNQTRNNGSEIRSLTKPDKPVEHQESNHSASIKLISQRIKDLLKNEIDVTTIHNFITTNLADGVDTENIRAILRDVVDRLMDEDILKLRGSKEAASILRMFFELLEK